MKGALPWVIGTALIAGVIWMQGRKSTRKAQRANFWRMRHEAFGGKLDVSGTRRLQKHFDDLAEDAGGGLADAVGGMQGAGPGFVASGAAPQG